MNIFLLLLAAAALAALLFALNALRLAAAALRREPLPKLLEKYRARESFVPLASVSPAFLRVLLAAEDPGFYRHRGFSPGGIYRAAKGNLRYLRRKAEMRGGSTLTQQLVKNVYLTPKKTFTRKLTELFLSLYMENRLSKGEILELYSNVIYYGSGNWGVRDAAAYYFGCAPSELTPNQSLTLANLLPNPDYFHPMDAPEAFYARRRKTLRYLLEASAVSEETAAAMEKTQWSDAAPRLRLTPQPEQPTEPQKNRRTGRFSDSPLAEYKKLSRFHSGRRTRPIDRITPHCAAGRVSVEGLGSWFRRPSAKASSNYGIGWDGRIALYVRERNRSWCSSDRENDQRAVTIECASDPEAPYAMSEAVYRSLARLCADICRRSGKKKLLWLGEREKALAYAPRPDEMVLTVHRWFAEKECPGDWLYSRLPELAKLVTRMLGDNNPRRNR